MTAILVVMTMAIGLLGLLVAGLLRSHAQILRQLHDLGAGLDGAEHKHEQLVMPTAQGDSAVAIDIAGIKAASGPVSVSPAGSDRPTLLAFMSSGCSVCAAFWSDFAEGVTLPGTGTRLVIVTKGPEAESESSVAALAPAGVTTVMSSQAWDDYAVPMSPYFVLVDGESARVAGEGTARTWPQVAELMQKALADKQRQTDRLDRNSAQRVRDSDEELAAAGIHRGDPSLHGPTP
ncbi:MAG: hypothetical protein OEM22_05060 [Acidimicrobiia bacterium]|nr:hypothetical protein [Acidimicrobiia bacterium]MDH3471006.1 hypothetical protein [Acidimicrobiia bacterium]